MRVALSPVRKELQSGSTQPAKPWLAASGAHVILGTVQAANALAEPVTPSATSLFGPRGVALAAPDGPLFVCDTGHHRLMIWHTTPERDGTPADSLIGQPDFSREGRNAKSEIGAATLNVPTGIAAEGGVLVVADAWNHRVLIWHRYPTRANTPADVVLGQDDFHSGLANRGRAVASASTLNWCYGVAIIAGKLFVADTGNRRVLRWDRIPTRNGAPADLVLGQADLTTRDENAGHDPDAMSMRWPHAICAAGGKLFVADAGNNRIMVWDEATLGNGAACQFVLGQTSMTAVDHNQAGYYPTAATLNMPYGLAVIGETLAVADTASSRVTGFDLGRIAPGAGATWLGGQPRFEDKGDNRWGVVRRDSLCWPYGLSPRGRTLAVADSGNNRILLWDLAP